MLIPVKGGFLHSDVGYHNKRAVKRIIPFQGIFAVKSLSFKNRLRSVFCPEKRDSDVSPMIYDDKANPWKGGGGHGCITSWRQSARDIKASLGKESLDSLTFHLVPPVLNKEKDQIRSGWYIPLKLIPSHNLAKCCFAMILLRTAFSWAIWKCPYSESELDIGPLYLPWDFCSIKACSEITGL